MLIFIPQSWKWLWDQWDLRAFTVLSFSLQVFLILLSPLRKRTANTWLITTLWSAYSLADWVATFALGLIFNDQTKAFCSSSSSSYKGSDSSNNGDLMAFWAPFLLLHLGGPDTIAAFALEDNELWLRHLLGLIFQCLAAVYIFLQSLPENKLWIPTLLMFIAGTIKYAERTRSLYLASLETLRNSIKDPDVGPDYSRLMKEYHSEKKGMLPVRIEMIPEQDRGIQAMNKVKEGKLTYAEILLYAQHFTRTFRGLIVNHRSGSRERNKSRDFFLKRSAEDAFKVVEVELNLMYAAFFTKFSVVYSGLGYLGRFLSFASVVASLALFYTESKRFYDSVDVAITYILLCGAIALDIIAFLMLISSDWFLVRIKKLPAETSTVSPANAAGREQAKPRVSWFGQVKGFFTRRWSESVSQFNLIYYCLHPRLPVREKFIGFLGLTNFFDSFKYVKDKPFTDDLRDHIFEEMQAKFKLADDLDTAKEISSARGDWVLRAEHQSDFLPYVLEVDYDESLLLWHIATELCYNEGTSHENSMAPNKYREFSKLLSDYMLYLLVLQPTIMFKVSGIARIRIGDTSAEGRRFLFTGKGKHKDPKICEQIFSSFSGIIKFLIFIFAFIVSPVFSFIFTSALIITLAISKYCCIGDSSIEWRKVLEMAEESYSAAMRFFNSGKPDYDEEQRDACKKILGVNTQVDHCSLKGDRSISVLFDGCILAKKLQGLGENKWQLMSKVWVELLSYAAIRCGADTHTQQLSKGGELITLVWLLMAHFGLGHQFQTSARHGR